jgi:hypothetical protein
MSKFKKNTYAKIYPSSGRYTGETEQFEENPNSPTWENVSGMDEQEFWNVFEWEEHDLCHSPNRSDWNCKYCKLANWG